MEYTRKELIEMLEKETDDNIKWFAVGFTDEDVDDAIKNTTRHPATQGQREAVLRECISDMEYLSGLAIENVLDWLERYNGFDPMYIISDGLKKFLSKWDIPNESFTEDMLVEGIRKILHRKGLGDKFPQIELFVSLEIMVDRTGFDKNSHLVELIFNRDEKTSIETITICPVVYDSPRVEEGVLIYRRRF